MAQFPPALLETAKGLSAVRGLAGHSDTKIKKKKKRKIEGGTFVNGVGPTQTCTHPRTHRLWCVVSW